MLELRGLSIGHGLVPLIAVLIGVVAGAVYGAGDDTTADRLAVARGFWEREYERAAENPNKTAYPTEPAITFLSAYAVTREAKYAEQATRQLAYAHSQERDGIIVVNYPGYPAGHRDSESRQIYNFYLAYRILGDGQYLRWADAAARAMIETIPRAAHECAGETHVQFASSFVALDDPKSTPPAYGIDVNQNAEVGLAFGLLYHDPASTFFADPLAREIAIEETLAGMSIQNMETGAIPLTEHAEYINKYDTAYGSYAAFCWVWSQLMWNDPRMDEHVRAAGRWLSAKMNLMTDSDRYYSFRNPSMPMPSWEATYRVVLFWYCGVDAGAYIAGLFERMPRETPGDIAVIQWAYYDLMGIPRAYYIGGLPEAARH